MKLSLIVSLVAGLAAATETSKPVLRSFRKRSITVEKFEGEYTLLAADKPDGAPAGYETSVVFTSEKRSIEGLEPVPADVQRRQESYEVHRRLGRQVVANTANDFFECTNSPSPVSADCGVITKNVLATGNDLVVAKGSCLVFAYKTCQGFFCSLCATLTTSTDFIGNQFDTVDALCVANGQSGAIVGQDPPQYQVGFIHTGTGLPNYDVC